MQVLKIQFLAGLVQAGIKKGQGHISFHHDTAENSIFNSKLYSFTHLNYKNNIL